MPALDLTGQKYGRLTPIKPAPKRGKHTCWFCRCDCGKETIASTSDMRTGNTTSCGCYHLERLRDDRLIHGGASRSLNGRTANGGAVVDPTYNVWLAMKERCHNPNASTYAKYGAKGTSVCARWRASYIDFLADMGPRPSSKHSIDRIDNNGNYEPGNCRWADAKTQRWNRPDIILFEHEGKIICVSDYAKLMGVSSKRVYKVMSTRGMSPQDAAAFVKEREGRKDRVNVAQWLADRHASQ